jgi:HK97 family phage prohead protease
MGFLDFVLGRSPVVQAATDAPTFAVDFPDDVRSVFGLPLSTDAVFSTVSAVSRELAIQVPAVKRVRDRVAASIGQLPLIVTAPDLTVARSPLLDQPERNVPRQVTLTRLAEDLFFHGLGYWEVTERGADRYPMFVRRHCPTAVTPDGADYKVDGRTVLAKDMIQFTSPNDAFLSAGARAIRTAIRLEAAAAILSDGTPPLDWFEPAEGADPVDDTAISEFLEKWRAARRARVTGYIPAALRYQTAGSSPKDLQLHEARQHAALEIARVAGVDPEDVGVSTTTRTYANAFDRKQDFLQITLGPYMAAIEGRLSMGDVTKRGYAVRFSLDDFLRADPLGRYQAYEVGERVGAITRAEIRAAEGKPAIPNSTTEDAPVTQSRFSGPAPEFTLSSPAATFRVDSSARTIKGLAVPYGEVAESNGRKWSFSKGTLQIPEATSRVKLFADHDYTKPLGHAVALEETDAGLMATFKVRRGPEGDAALMSAEDNVHDGLSIGVAAGGQYDERDGVFHAVSAPLAEVSLTALPAYDSARLTEVKASAASQNPDKEEATVPDTNPAPAADFSAIAEAIKTGFESVAASNGPETIAPVTPQFTVNEPLVYRFDGGKGEHDFSTDLFASLRFKDGEATERLDKFMDAAFDVTSANVSALNPSRNRPDMYVDQLDYSTPLWDAMNKGTLTDQTPFIVPKYSASANLVADHVQGTAPATEGSFSATAQTITPTALSGKIDVVREVVDAGGNPQVSGLIWGQIVRAYNEALEAKAAALLGAQAPTALITTPAAGAAGAVVGTAVEAGLAGLQFVRGGDRFNRFVGHIGLYKALVGAVDTTGRKLYPILGATNANGTVANDFGRIVIGSKVLVPAWALGSDDTVAGGSYLFSSEDVHGWASAPKRFEFDYRVEAVDLAVWGYVATAVTRAEGIRKITYDATA